MTFKLNPNVATWLEARKNITVEDGNRVVTALNQAVVGESCKSVHLEPGIFIRVQTLARDKTTSANAAAAIQPCTLAAPRAPTCTARNTAEQLRRIEAVLANARKSCFGAQEETTTTRDTIAPASVDAGVAAANEPPTIEHPLDAGIDGGAPSATEAPAIDSPDGGSAPLVLDGGIDGGSENPIDASTPLDASIPWTDADLPWTAIDASTP